MDSEVLDGARPILPARYNPRDGRLHRDPCDERCNLDQAKDSIKIKTIQEVLDLPAETTFCHWAGWTSEEIMRIAKVRDERDRGTEGSLE